MSVGGWSDVVFLFHFLCTFPVCTPPHQTFFSVRKCYFYSAGVIPESWRNKMSGGGWSDVNFFFFFSR